MAYEQRDNSGSLFKNERKETDNHPDYNGSALIDGTAYWMSAWLNESRDGKKYMSFKFKPKDAPKTISERAAIKDDPRFSSGRTPQKPMRPVGDDLDDTIPF
jgi:uncharacterized protein (DUF736 family)